MKKIVKKSRRKNNSKKINGPIPLIHAVAVIIIVAVFFTGWIWKSGMQMIQSTQTNITTLSHSNEKKSKKEIAARRGAQGAEVKYENKDLGFGLMLPKSRYAVKEVDQKGQNRAILFGLPTTDANIKESKKSDYNEVFRIELVPASTLGKSACADKKLTFPLCDKDDQELGRNDRFVFVYTRYDKLDAVEKNEVKLIPADFRPEVFAQADEIIRSFQLIPEKVSMAE